MELEFESQVPNIPDYSNLLNLCVDVFSQDADHSINSAMVSIAIVSENTIQKLNAQYRGKNQVTDVLSFTLWEEHNPNLPVLTLGEIVICYKKAKQQAKDLGHSLEYEIATLCIHGLCHLIGYDHQTDEDYIKMKAKEDMLLARLNQDYSFS